MSCFPVAMDFDGWQRLSPREAAREFSRRARFLSPEQHGAIFAAVLEEPRLESEFSASSGPLRGIPTAVKDLFDVKGMPTAAGSKFLAGIRPSPPDESQIVRSIRKAGLVPVAKTQLFEFAWGLTGENPHSGDCEHPAFPGRTSGGSSSGSAAAVAAGIVPFALGTDTGGSVRVPAAFCGIFGYRGIPSVPWISDAVPLAPGFDAPGWFTRTARDMRTVLSALVGTVTQVPGPRGCYLEPPDLDPEIAQAFRQAAEAFAPEADSATRDELLSSFSDSADLYRVAGPFESWKVHEAWADRFWDDYGPELRLRLLDARKLTAGDCAKAWGGIVSIRTLFEKYFRTHDFLILPATPCAALTKADCTPASRARMLALTAPASLAGLPVLTLPVFLPSGLSTGLQLIVREPKSAALVWALTRTEG